MQVLSKLEELNQRYEDLNQQLARPEVMADPKKLKKLSQEQAELSEIVKTYRALTNTLGEIRELETMLQEEEDHELVSLAREDLPRLKSK
ncbi:MAG: PCRF domain-containing protein, partial [Desulfomonilaceae bacterium]